MVIPTFVVLEEKNFWDVNEHLESQAAQADWKNLQEKLCSWVSNYTFCGVKHLNLVTGFMLDMIYSEFLIMPLPQIKSCYSTQLTRAEILPNVFGAC